MQPKFKPREKSDPAHNFGYPDRLSLQQIIDNSLRDVIGFFAWFFGSILAMPLLSGGIIMLALATGAGLWHQYKAGYRAEAAFYASGLCWSQAQQVAHLLNQHPPQPGVKEVQYSFYDEDYYRVFRDSLNYVLPFKVEALVTDTSLLPGLESRLLQEFKRNNGTARVAYPKRTEPRPEGIHVLQSFRQSANGPAQPWLALAISALAGMALLALCLRAVQIYKAGWRA